MRMTPCALKSSRKNGWAPLVGLRSMTNLRSMASFATLLVLLLTYTATSPAQTQTSAAGKDGGAGATKGTAPRASTQKAATSKGSGSNAGDAAIEREIRERLSRSKISSNGFTVSVSNGVATLRGQTAVAQHKGVATRLAKLGGAKTVVNEITISAAGKQKLEQSLQKGRAAGKTGDPSLKAPKDTGSAGRATRMSAQNETKPDSQNEGAQEGVDGRSVSVPSATAAGQNTEPLADERVTPTSLPRMRVLPPAPRGEARSERRRY